jgi:hypothetical protein
MTDYSVYFNKYVNVRDNVDINKDIDVHVFVKGNSAMANSTADAYGSNTHTETLTQTTSAQPDPYHHMTGYSGSVSESVSASTKAYDFHW